MPQVNVDAVPPLVGGGDLGNGPVHLARLGRAVGQADDAADRKASFRLADIGVMAAAVDTIDHQIAPVAILVGESARDDAPDDGNGIPVVDRVKLGRPLQLCLGHRPVHRLDDVAALAHRSEHVFRIGRQRPAERSFLRCKLHTFELPRPRDQQLTMSALEVGAGIVHAKVDHAVLGAADQRPVETGQAFGLDFVLQLPLHLLLGLRTEVAGQHLARSVPDAVGKIVAGDVEDFPVLGDAAYDDMDVRMAGVVMIDGHPIERRAEIGFHPRHDIPCERLQVLIGRAVLRREDDPELMAVLQPAFDERVAVRLVGEGRIEPARSCAC